MIIAGIYSLLITAWLLQLLIKDHMSKGYNRETRIVVLIQLPVCLYILATLIERIRLY